MFSFMKRIFIAIMMFLNLFAGHCAKPADWADKARYAAANDALSQIEDSSRVVMMGNSITEYWEEMHPGFFTANHLVCRGISGQVSSQMLARFRQDVINLNPSVVVINCGTNDIAENNGPYDEDITMDNIMSMAELALSHGIRVVLSSVLPADGFVWNPNVRDAPVKIMHLNERIKAYCVEEKLPYIDYYSWMTADGSSMIKAYTEDGVHPCAAGYDVMEVRLLEMLNQLNTYYNNL